MGWTWPCQYKWKYLLRPVESRAIIDPRKAKAIGRGFQRSRDTVGGKLSSLFLSPAQTLCPQEERGEYDGDAWRFVFHTHIFSRICRFCAETYEKAQKEQEKMTAPAPKPTVIFK